MQFVVRICVDFNLVVYGIRGTDDVGRRLFESARFRIFASITNFDLLEIAGEEFLQIFVNQMLRFAFFVFTYANK